MKVTTKGRNIARLATVKMLILIETLNEFRTGKRCSANVDFCMNIGVGYHRRIEENAVVEFYLFPFTRVTITTFTVGFTMPNAATNES